MTKVTILLASDGMNKELANTIKKDLLRRGSAVEIINIVELDLPLYTSKKEKEETPIVAQSLFKKINESDSLIVVAPEYNGTMPPALINAVTWVSRASDDWRDAFTGKPVALAGHSGSGGNHLMISMRNYFSFLGANVLGKELITTYSKEVDISRLEDMVMQLIQMTSWRYDPIKMINQGVELDFEASY